jgi:hypothetical protein
MYVRIRINVYMYVGRVTYPAVPFALDLEGGAGRSKNLRVLSETLQRIDGLHVCMYVCMHACI